MMETEGQRFIPGTGEPYVVEAFHVGEPASLAQVDSRSGPLSNEEIRVYNEMWKENGDGYLPIDRVDMRRNSAMIRKTLGLPAKKPEE